MKQYSADLRERLLGAIDAGLPQAEAARLFGVGLSTIKRWRRRRQADRLRWPPRRAPDGRGGSDAEAETALVAQVRAAPDATLVEHCDTWAAATGVAVSPATMSRALGEAGVRLKKSTSSPPNAMTRPCRLAGRRGHPPPRGPCLRGQDQHPHRPDPASGASPAGRARRGPHPPQPWPQRHPLAALTPTGIGPAPSSKGRPTARRWPPTPSKSRSQPATRPGRVLDNLSAHKDEHARPAVEAAGARLLFLRLFADINPSNWPSPSSKSAGALPPSASSDGSLTATAVAISRRSPPRMPMASTPTVASPSRPTNMRIALGRGKLGKIQTRASTDLIADSR